MAVRSGGFGRFYLRQRVVLLWFAGSSDSGIRGSPHERREDRGMRRMYATAFMVFVPSILAVLAHCIPEPTGPIEPSHEWTNRRIPRRSNA